MGRGGRWEDQRRRKGRDRERGEEKEEQPVEREKRKAEINSINTNYARILFRILPDNTTKHSHVTCLQDSLTTVLAHSILTQRPSSQVNFRHTSKEFEGQGNARVSHPLVKLFLWAKSHPRTWYQPPHINDQPMA